MDDIDRAQAREQELRDDALAEHSLRMARSADRHAGAKFCDDCGDPIPEPRQRVVPGVTRCVECEGWHERGL